MPITPYLKGPYYFDLETRRALGIALEMACIALSTGDDDEHVRRTIADKLIARPSVGRSTILKSQAPTLWGEARSHWLVQHPLLNPSLLASGN